MQYKIYNLKGLNIRSSDLNRDAMEASDLLNVYRNKKGDVEDRPGTSDVTTGFGGNGLFNYVKDKILIGIDAVVKKLVAGAWIAVENTAFLSLSTSEMFSGFNVRDSLYFASEDEKILKFDGKGFYRAGIPRAWTSSGGATSASSVVVPVKIFRYAFQYMTIDKNNFTVESQPSIESPLHSVTCSIDIGAYVTFNFWGPCLDYDNISTGKWLQNTAYTTVDRVLAPDNNIYRCTNNHNSSTGGTPLDDFLSDLSAYWELAVPDVTGFQAKYAVVNGAQQDTVTINVDSGHNLVADDVVYVEPNAALMSLIMEARSRDPGKPELEFSFYRTVASVTATTVTLDGEVWATDYPDNFILTNTFGLIYQRNHTDGGDFVLQKQAPIDPRKVIQTTDIYVDDAPLGTYPTYDQTRGLPPVARDMAFFQELIFVILNDFEVAYSDALNKEVFPVGDNVLTIGYSEDGANVAITSLDDYLFVFKEKEIYFATGTFGANQSLRTWPSESKGRGCIAKKSVQTIDKQIFYLCKLGFFQITGGSLPTEISERINQIITKKIMPDGTAVDLQLETAISQVDTINSLYICYIQASVAADSITLVYDYYYRDWYIWQGFRADGGIAIVDDILYFQGKDAGKTLVKQDDTAVLEDSGVAMNAFYSTHWHDATFPGIEKKFIRAKIYSITDTANSFNVKSQINWIKYTEYDKDLEFTGTGRKSQNVGIDKVKSQSIRLIFQALAGKKMIITGYEFKTDPAMKEMKK